MRVFVNPTHPVLKCKESELVLLNSQVMDDLEDPAYYYNCYSLPTRYRARVNKI